MKHGGRDAAACAVGYLPWAVVYTEAPSTEEELLESCAEVDADTHILGSASCKTSLERYPAVKEASLPLFFLCVHVFSNYLFYKIE